MSSTTTPSLDAFIEEIATLAAVPPSSIDRSTQLIDDLELDSLALSELAVLLIDQFGIEAPADELQELPWDQLSVGALFDRYMTRTGPSATSRTGGRTTRTPG